MAPLTKQGTPAISIDGIDVAAQCNAIEYEPLHYLLSSNRMERPTTLLADMTRAVQQY